MAALDTEKLCECDSGKGEGFRTHKNRVNIKCECFQKQKVYRRKEEMPSPTNFFSTSFASQEVKVKERENWVKVNSDGERDGRGDRGTVGGPAKSVGILCNPSPSPHHPATVHCSQSLARHGAFPRRLWTRLKERGRAGEDQGGCGCIHSIMVKAKEESIVIIGVQC